MIRYELKRGSGEFYSKKDIFEGCILPQRTEYEPDLIYVSADRGCVLKEFERYRSEFLEINNNGYYVSYSEYFVEIAECSESGEWIASGNILAFSPVPERLKGDSWQTERR